jgi:DNA-binding NtrC family response regulator
MAIRKPLALVSEDTELGQWALTHALEAEGFEVQTASTWVEASACLARARFRLALVAISSEQETASDIVDYIRRHHQYTHLILLADQDDVGALRLACGPEPAILAKPLNLGQIVQLAHALQRPGDDTLRA